MNWKRINLELTSDAFDRRLERKLRIPILLMAFFGAFGLPILCHSWMLMALSVLELGASIAWQQWHRRP
jgi:hypothetical protein